MDKYHTADARYLARRMASDEARMVLAPPSLQLQGLRARVVGNHLSAIVPAETFTPEARLFVRWAVKAVLPFLAAPDYLELMVLPEQEARAQQAEAVAREIGWTTADVRPPYRPTVR